MAENPVELASDGCLTVSAGAQSVGRVVFCVNGHPQVYPVNFAIDDDTIVIRASPYGPMAAVSLDALSEPQPAWMPCADRVEAYPRRGGWPGPARGVLADRSRATGEEVDSYARSAT